MTYKQHLARMRRLRLKLIKSAKPNIDLSDKKAVDREWARIRQNHHRYQQYTTGE